MISTGKIADGHVAAVSLKTSKPVLQIEVDKPALCLAVSANSKFLAIGTGVEKSKTIGNVVILHNDSFQTFKTLEIGYTPSVAFSPDGKIFATVGGAENAVRLYTAKTFKLGRDGQGHSGDIHCVAFSPNSKRLATGSSDKSVIIWEVPTLAVVNALMKLDAFGGHGAAVVSVVFLTDEILVSGGNDSTVAIWNTDNGDLVASIKVHKGPVNSVAVSPDRTRFASASDDHTVVVYDAASYNPIVTIKLSGPVKSIAFGDDDTIFAAVVPEENLVSISISKGKIKNKFAKHVLCTAVAISPNPCMLILSVPFFSHITHRRKP